MRSKLQVREHRGRQSLRLPKYKDEARGGQGPDHAAYKALQKT